MDGLSTKALEQIYRHASDTYPDECCGLVFKDGSVYIGENIQDELHRRNPEVYQRTAAEGYTFSVADTLMINKSFRSDNPVTVIYHSHPDVGAYFSHEDQDKALFMGEPIYPVSYLVIDARKGTAFGSKLFEWNGQSFFCSQAFS
jgi:adenylyltransferase/sulfurtransferase